MGRDAAFLDTSGLVGLFLPADSLHAAAAHTLDTLARAGTPLVCSEWVLAEFLNGASTTRQRGGAHRFVRRLFAEPTLTVVEATHESFQNALELHESRPDKEWSLVDCSSMHICKEMGIRRIFTHDGHFRQAGFAVLL